jgi:hypothetical protein
VVAQLDKQILNSCMEERVGGTWIDGHGEWIYGRTTHGTNQSKLEISGSHGGEYEDYSSGMLRRVVSQITTGGC